MDYVPEMRGAFLQVLEQMKSGAEPREPGILVIDSDLGILGLLESALARRGFAVWRATSAEDAFLLYRSRREGIDLVLTDTHVRGVSGSDLITCLQLINPGLRFCFMADTLTDGEQAALLELGASWLFPKPFPVQQVVEILWHLAWNWRADCA